MSRWLPVRATPVGAVAMTLAVAASALLCLHPHEPGREWPALWLTLPFTIGGLAVFWPDRRPPKTRAFALLVLAFGVAFVGGAVLAGLGPGRAAYLSVLNLLTALVFGWVYRLRNSIDDWAPGSAADAVMLCLLGVAFAVLLVAAHGIEAGSVLSTGGALWIDRLARANGGLVAYLPAVILALVSARRPATRVTFRLRDVPLVLLVAVCAALPYLTPAYPLSWLLLVPALWLGLTFTPRIVAVAAAFAPAVTMLSTSMPYWWTPREGDGRRTCSCRSSSTSRPRSR